VEQQLWVFCHCRGENRAKSSYVSALDSPLLNDNKITGAKTYCCSSFLVLITLDEIGGNDHIQNEAGHNANIIIGVGEDETLGDAIAVLSSQLVLLSNNKMELLIQNQRKLFTR
jgi:cell division GTPase FtsZ